MLLSYVYKLRPSRQQSGKMSEWLDMLRSLYNWFLADRIDGYHQSFIQGEYCDMRTKTVRTPLTCSLNKSSMLHNPWKQDGKRRSPGLMQDAYLPELKASRPWYKAIHSNVLQMLIKRLDAAMEGFYKHGRGFPKFKNRSNFHSFAYKPSDIKFKGSKVYLPSVGWMRFHNSRPIPDGFSVRTVTIRSKADGGWYMSVRIEDKSIPNFSVLADADVHTVVGLDMGLGKLIYCSDGSTVNNPRFATTKLARRTSSIRQRRVSRKKKGSCNKHKYQQQVSRLQQKIAERRESYQWKTASRIVAKADGIAVEDLNIRGMKARCKPKYNEQEGRFLPNGQSAKRGLNRSISDAAWGELIEKIKYVAAKSGKKVYLINPKHTSQECSACHHIDADNRDGERFICTACGHIDDANLQAARNIRARAVQQYDLALRKVRRDSPKPFSEPVQLAQRQTPTPESTGGKRRQHAAQASKRYVPGNLSVQLELFNQDILSASSLESPLF